MTEGEAKGGAFDKYRPIAELGHGGMAQVFLALASGPAGFNKLVVIKQIRENLADDPEFLTMFLDEARLAARLNHPNVVQTNEVGGEGKRFYICMEYLEGQPLNRVMHRVGAARGLTLGMQLRILVDALAGLHHAHELCDFDGRPLQVVHRDATPHNIFVTYAGQVKVVDFGIAKALSSSAETRTGVLKGKVAYMAPEQAMGERVDRRADVFSVGMILWEMLAGKRLFKGMPDVAVLQKIINGAIPPPSSVNPEVAPELEAICTKALAHSRDDRYATAAEMADDLERTIDALGLKGSVRDAGKLIDGFFAGERAKIQKLVEEQATAGRAAMSLASFDPRMTGSGPRLPVLDDHATHTQEGSVDSGSGSTRTKHSQGSGSGALRSEPPTPSTLTAATASSPLVHTPPHESRMPLLATLAVAMLGVGGLAAFFATRTPPAAPPAATTAQPSAEAHAHAILVDSTPQGATVTEGDKVLGTTPMALDIDPTAPPRKLVMTLAGHAPHTFLPTKDDTRIMVPLAPLPQAAGAGATATATAAPVALGGTAKPPVDKPVRAVPHPPAPPPAAKPTPPPSDINMAR